MSSIKNILVAGGAGYIGSHTYVELKEAGYTPIILDNFANSSAGVLDRLATLFQEKPTFIEGDIRDTEQIEKALTDYNCDAVIHFAGCLNVGGSERLFAAMKNTGVKKLIFSSSATVYGDPQQLPIPEDHPLSTASVYGQTKLMVEEMLRALYASDPSWSICILRYFNPVGAHVSGMIGEDPSDIPNNLMPFISQTAVGRRKGTICIR
ncbi:UDP-glucose 4-epimerase [Nymphon striatum]|nr:UDP-glucose 4-epimerase [Nymphon striatum]